MSATDSGTIVCIGGGEDRTGELKILSEVASRVQGGILAVSGVASDDPIPLYEEYERVFGALGIRTVRVDIRQRSDAAGDDITRSLEGVSGFFFTGGDQLRLTSRIGGTPVVDMMWQVYEAGGLVGGTSAGATAMCSTMLVGGKARESHKIGDSQLARGLGFVEWAIIDQHFAERGRMGRLLGAVSENPQILGIGIDEDTAILVEGEDGFSVLGRGAVYVIDGSSITHSNVAENALNKTLSVYNLTVHVLAAGDYFGLNDRAPVKIK